MTGSLGARRERTAEHESGASLRALDPSRFHRPGRAALGGALLVLLSLACGKKGDPEPPFPRGPRAMTDLAVEQEAADAVLTFTYPDRLLSGQPLTDLASIEIYRVVNPSPSLTTTPKPGTAPRPNPSGAARTDLAPAAGARQAAVNLRVAQEAFYRDAEKAAVLSIGELARHTRGATIVFEDPLTPLFARKETPRTVGYAAVAVRKGGEKSPLSNIVVLAPDVPPAAPTLVAVTAEEGRICLEWTAPDKDLLGRPDAKVGGYFIYRRTLSEEEYGPPLNAKPHTGTAYVDAGPPYGSPLVYTLRATVPDKPKIEGAAADEAAVDYRDVFPPAAPARLDALSEAALVRLVWDPVGAADLAGYAIFRSEGGKPPVRLNAQLAVDTSWEDTTVQRGHRYVYTVRAYDQAGNASAASPQAVGEPF